ncbi:inner centromere protein A isoform X2 [Venturia canescens]|uniref:inner centromere protein A isoform X2 n=1 Tax=Venturia canescens TaxID=32260 RepID=UPI001C9C41A8|nr:inner centromere protein A-like isoform X2 [Venturia canescens]
MNGWTKEVTLNIIQNKITSIRDNYDEFVKAASAIEKESLEFLEGLIEQIPNAISGPLIPKTPKVPKKRELKRIQTIPEDDIVRNLPKTSETLAENSRTSELVFDDAPPPRIRRAASQKAAQKIKDQEALGVGSKLRRPSSIEDSTISQPKGHLSRVKRTKSVLDTSDEEDTKRPVKLSKIKSKSQDNSEETKELDSSQLELDRTINHESQNKKEIPTRETSVRVSRNKRQREKSQESSTRQNNSGSGKTWQEPAAKKANIDESCAPETDVTMDASLYEDAIGKSIPMNSTMNPNTTVTIDRKIMDVTVVLDHIKMPRQMNETVTLKKTTRSSFNADKTLVNKEQPIVENTIPQSPRATTVLQSKMHLPTKMQTFKETFANPEFDALITEDESSPEKEDKKNKKANEPKNKVPVKETKRFTRSSLITDDDDVYEVSATPPRPKTVLRDANNLKPPKNSYKANALFSPYSKESVKKRVEAFEQAGLNSPKTVEIDAPARLTRTKTRALAAAASETLFTQTGLTVAQKAARKSLSRAKEIAKMKERKENEESKEKTSRLLAMSEKYALKQQQRTTPIGKSRLQMPMSVSRIPHTPSDSHIIPNKPMSAVKSNITSVDSFMQPPKTLTKSSSNDNLAEKRRRVNDEDVKRKREETLKALTEEKKRKREEKELKNKLAREAKEKLELEKRLKQEREREEKAKAALILQEKQREELERKRLVQLQRAQEKEERRRQEEQLRFLRLQEQEEAERQLAEQKRREQEAEKRRIAELRNQHAAAAEAARLKAQYLAKMRQAQQDPTSYILDSDNPDDESDDESRPKHVIPYWAQEGVRATQLGIQQYIPMKSVLTFFGAKRCTPDLTQLFKGIKKERLQRTSSAIWKTPPRYSMMNNE